ncbi:MAG: glycosyl hydrolase-related protein [Dehalococcoidia bacterium]
MTTSSRTRMVLVPHTHWDREWYYPFQRYRTRLTGFFDLLLEILERDPEYRHFLLDGHTILIEDYLEVRPDRRETIDRLARAGRLAVGPWYVIPDENLPSGEALVRNILRGHKVAAQFGGAMDVGYIPDPFGQIAHMPAIFRGFGIDRCIWWRGADASLQTTELLWESPDGSAVFAVHMPGGYGIAGPFPFADEEEFIERLQQVRARLQPLAQTSTLVAMWGSDHIPPQEELSTFVRAANARLPDAEVVVGSLPEAFDEIESQLGSRDGLYRHVGEFRSGQRAHLLPGVTSARMWIKQRTFDCEQLLTRWAEPLTLWSETLRARLGEAWNEPPRVAGPSSPFPKEALSEAGLIDRAWKLLLENQPHDSICGCSIDQTHDEMRPRFDQCEQVGEDLAYQAMRRIGAQGPAERVFVFNPLPGPRSDFATAVVPAKRGSQPVALVDENGHRWPCQPVDHDEPPEAVRAGPNADRLSVGFVAGGVPGFGYRAYEVEYGEPAETKPRSKSRIENDIFIVDASRRDGSLRVEMKGVAVRYTGLNRLVDGGDRGDEYNYCAPEPDVLVDRPAAQPEVRVLEAGPARQTLEIRMSYRLPSRLTARRQRARRTVSCPVRVLVSLSPGVPRIDIRTEFENLAEDHRLRAHFPSGVTTGVAYAEQHFGVVSRPLALPEADDTWMEQPIGTHPHKTFVDVNDGRGGLLIANRGLPEYEVLDTRAGATIALTLLRAVGWLSRNDFPSRKGHAGPPLATPAGQEPGRHVFEYSIIPHRGSWAAAYAEAHRFAVPLRARWNPPRRAAAGPRGPGLRPPSGSLLDVEGDGVVVTALKRAEDGDGTVVRLYNTLDSPSGGRVRLAERWDRAQVVDMKEDALGPADVAGGWVRLNLRSNEIVTLRFS